ncbi:unnamed protein product, partial [marine sediment metagenome]
MAEITNNKFVKGMVEDVNPSEQTPQTYRYGLNFTHLTEQGDKYSISNEDGTVLMNVTFPTGKRVVGHSVLNTDIIVVLAGEDGTSQVGYIREDSSPDPTYGFYHPVAPVDSLGVPVDDNSELGFKLSHYVDCVSRKVIDGSRILYFTDNLNPFGRIVLDNPPTVGTVKEEVQLVFNQSFPTVNFVRMQENVAGSLIPSVYQFTTRYV